MLIFDPPDKANVRDELSAFLIRKYPFAGRVFQRGLPGSDGLNPCSRTFIYSIVKDCFIVIGT